MNDIKYKNEQEVVIQTLTDKELKDYAPPIVSKKPKEKVESNKGSDTPANQNNKNTKQNQNRPKNSSCVTMVNEFLGVGGFSKVYKFKNDDKNKAVKKIMSNPKIYSAKLTILDSVKREVFGMLKCACKHTVKLYEVFQNQAQDNFFLLMELCKGNLEHLMTLLGRPLKTCEIKEILIQLNEVFYKLYSANIIHRDIKPTNILYTEEPENKNDNTNNEDKKDLPFNGKKLIFKLTDYGVCLPLYSENFSISQFMGTLDFMAPEIYDKKTSIEQPMYTTKIDLFSLGETILNLMGFIKKAKPLDCKMIADLRKANTLFNGSFEDQLLADLIFNNLLIADPDDRVNWELYFLHPFFEKNEEDNQIIIENNKDNNDNKNDDKKNDDNKNNDNKNDENNNNDNKNDDNKNNDNKNNDNQNDNNKNNDNKNDDNKNNDNKNNDNQNDDNKNDDKKNDDNKNNDNKNNDNQNDDNKNNDIKNNDNKNGGNNNNNNDNTDNKNDNNKNNDNNDDINNDNKNNDNNDNKNDDNKNNDSGNDNKNSETKTIPPIN